METKKYVIYSTYSDIDGAMTHHYGIYSTAVAAKKSFPMFILDWFGFADKREWYYEKGDKFDSHFSQNKMSWVMEDGESTLFFAIREVNEY